MTAQEGLMSDIISKICENARCLMEFVDPQMFDDIKENLKDRYLNDSLYQQLNQIFMHFRVTILVIVAVTLLAIFQSPQEVDEYLEWKKKFGIIYCSREDNYRRHIFKDNIEIISNHNKNNSQTYKMGINQFSALTDQQFRSNYLKNVDRFPTTHKQADIQVYDKARKDIGQIDWSELGQVSPVKNQGSCGSCWAFSAVGILQSWALSKGTVVDLSQQQLVDCSHLYLNVGCEGGINQQALAYVRDHGITQTNKYPYVARDQLCKIRGGNFKITKINVVFGCDNIASAIMNQPIGVSVDAANWGRYASGIFSNCGTHLDHDVLLVGISSSFYKIKNSWGTTWGEKGFIRLAPGNTCGICSNRSPQVQ